MSLLEEKAPFMPSLQENLEYESLSSTSSSSVASFSGEQLELELEEKATVPVEEISEGAAASTREAAVIEAPLQEYTLWAWPLNEDGFVHAWSKKEKFTVALDFKYLLSRDAEIKKFDTFKASGSSYTFTIGLCSIKRADLSFWRLEVHLFNFNDLILVEAFREVFYDYSTLQSRVNKKLRRLRKTYRLPAQYDIKTATVAVSEKLGAIIIEALPRATPRLI